MNVFTFSPARRPVLCALLLLLVTLAAYWPAFSAGAVWDDDAYIVKNDNLGDAQGLGRIWAQPRSSPQYYPLVFTTFWIERHAFGTNLAATHVVNVLLHVANALWLWAILARLGLPGGYLAAFLFALHPVHVESVAWMTERKNLLSGFFYLAALWTYLPVVLDESPRATRLGRSVAALLLFVCALLSKTVTATWPAVVLSIAWWKQGRVRWPGVVRLVPFAVIGGVFALGTAWLEVHHVGAEGADWSLSAWGRMLLATRVPWFYAWKLVWPHPLVFIYPRWTIDAAAAWQYLFPLLTGGAIAASWWRARVDRSPLAVLACYLVTLVPVLGILNVYPMRYSFVADHFQYLASAAPIAGFVAWVVPRVSAVRRLRLGGVVAAAALLAAASVTTRAETRKFDNLETLWQDTLAKNPEAWIAHNNLGNLRMAEHRYEEARASFERALALKPDLAIAYNNLGTSWFYQGRLEEATANHRRAVELDPRYAEALNNLGVDLLRAGHVAEGIEDYRRALAADPEYAMAHFNLANAFVRKGDEVQAQKEYREAIRLKPDLAMAHFSLGLSLLAGGARDEARASLAEAFRLQPDFAVGHYQVGNMALRQGDIDLAIAEYEAAIGLKPDYAEACSNLGAALIRAGRTADAVSRLEQALRLRPDYPIAHYNLGSALEALGRRDEALAHYREAFRLDAANAQAQAAIERVQRGGSHAAQEHR